MKKEIALKLYLEIFLLLKFHKQVYKQVHKQVYKQVHNTIDVLKEKVLNYCEIPKSSKKYVDDSIIKPLLKAGMLEYTNKKSIHARNQKYITVKK